MVENLKSKTKVNLIIIILILLANINLNAASINGNIANSKSTNIQLSLYQEMLEPPLVLDAKINYGKFKFDFQIDKATFAILNYNGDEIKLFVEPENQLTLNFEDYEPLKTLIIEGNGAVNNNFYHLFNQSNYEIRNNIVMYKLNVLNEFEIIDYLEKMEKKRYYFWYLTEKSTKNKLSLPFTIYFLNELHYWMPHYAMLYRKIHGQTNGYAAPLNLNYNYYRFLSKVLIINEKGLNNFYYTSFLKEYVDWCQDNPEIALGILNNLSKVNIENQEINLYSSSKMDTIKATLSQSYDIIWNFNNTEIAPTNVDGTMKCYPITTIDGIEGWVDATSINLTNYELNNSICNFEFITFPEKRIRNVCSIIMDGIHVVDSPENMIPIDTLSSMESVVYLNEKTDNTFNYQHFNDIFNDHFYKIKTNKNKVGWIFSGSALIKEIEDSIIITKAQFKSGESTLLFNLDRFLTGEPLAYCLANDFIKKFNLENPEIYIPQFLAFDTLTQNNNYKKIVQKYFSTNFSIWNQNSKVPILNYKKENFETNQKMPVCEFKILPQLTDIQEEEPHFERPIKQLVKFKIPKNYQFLDLNKKEFSIFSDSSQYTIIDFWATWCKPCLEYMPTQEKIAIELLQKNINFVWISIDANFDSWKNLVLSKTNIKSHCWVGNSEQVMNDFGFDKIPYTIIINRNGDAVLFDQDDLDNILVLLQSK